MCQIQNRQIVQITKLQRKNHVMLHKIFVHIANNRHNTFSVLTSPLHQVLVNFIQDRVSFALRLLSRELLVLFCLFDHLKLRILDWRGESRLGEAIVISYFDGVISFGDGNELLHVHDGLLLAGALLATHGHVFVDAFFQFLYFLPLYFEFLQFNYLAELLVDYLFYICL